MMNFISLSDILKFGALCRIFRVGNAIVRQILGVPMGGHLSMIFISLLLCKNSGGEASFAKLLAARELSIPILMMKRPELPEVSQTESIDEVVKWLANWNLFRFGTQHMNMIRMVEGTVPKRLFAKYPSN